MKWCVLLVLVISACSHVVAPPRSNVISPSAALERVDQLNGSIVNIYGYVVRSYGNACLFDNAKFASAVVTSVRDPHALALLIPNGQVEKFKSADHKMVTITGRLQKSASPKEIVLDICSTPFVEVQSFQISH